MPDESVQSPDTIRSRKSVDKIHRKEKEREKEKEKDKEKESRRKSKSKKERDEPSFLESTEFKLTMQKLEDEGSASLTVQLVE